MRSQELKSKTCCFTGHRKLPAHQLPLIARKTEEAIRQLITTKQVCFFGVGGALGYDTLAAEILFHLRSQEFPFIKIILVYPFDSYTDVWSDIEKEKHLQLLPQYDKIVCISKHPDKEAYLARNRHLVNGSSYCIAYCTHKRSGSAYTLRYAKEQGLITQNISDNL